MLQKTHRKQGQLSSHCVMSFAAFLEVEIIGNSFSLPGAKIAFFLWCVCVSSKQRSLGASGAAWSEGGLLFKCV